MWGRCSRSWVTAGATTTTSRPAAQPNKTIEATPKTNDSETPGGPTPSTGTGKRSASVDAIMSAATPRMVVVLCGVIAKETIAAHVTARPARQTGMTTASRRGGGKARCLTAPLPVQVQPVLEACAEQCDQKQRDNGGKGNEARTPLQHLQPPHGSEHNGEILPVAANGHIPRKGELLRLALLALDQAGLGERPAPPGKRLAVPAGQRHDRDALARGVDHPAGTEVDPRVADRARLGPRPLGPEEDEVARRELREADPLRARNFAAHLVRRSALDRGVQCGSAGIRLQLVYPPDEAGAVEAAACLHAERRLGLLARSTPDVREADELDGRVEHALLPGAERWQRERGDRIFGVLLLPAAEAQDLGDRVGGFRTRDGVAREQFEVVVLRRVVRAKTEQARNGLGAEAGGDAQAGGPSAVQDRRRGIGELERLHEASVQLGDRDRSRRIRGGVGGCCVRVPTRVASSAWV